MMSHLLLFLLLGSILGDDLRESVNNMDVDYGPGMRMMLPYSKRGTRTRRIRLDDRGRDIRRYYNQTTYM